jgi:threonine synthase
VDGLPRNKLRQMLAYGARIFSIRRFALDPVVTTAVLDRLQRLAAERNAALQISAYCYSRPGMIGVESIAYELAEQLPEQIEHVFCPAGGGGLVLAVARGFANLRARKLAAKLVAVECVQPEGNDTMAGPLARGEERARPTTSTTRISGLQVATVNDGQEVLDACRACGGTGHLVSDAQIYAAQARLAREEGIFTEPAGAAALAGALAARRSGKIRPDATVVCCVTGIGFKDESSVDALTAQADCPYLETPADLDDFLPAG